MLCPSDSFNLAPFNGSTDSLTNQMGDNWARGNYGANASQGYLSIIANGGAGPQYWNNKYLQGVMGANDSLRIDDISDGASNTILLLEMRAGIVPFDSRGVWAMSGACPSACWASGYYSDANGPNCNLTNGDDPRACSDIQAAVGGDTALINMGMSCCAGNYADWQTGSRSLHRNGVNVVNCDGSVHFISDFVQKGYWTGAAPPGPPGVMGVWDKLLLSNDHLPLDGSTW
jgi:hypothetical protein